MKQNKRKIALAGNPNVGKSTVFNALTGMHQHTGNWPGKTVSNASGEYTYQNKLYRIYDLPGTYSLISHSEEEEIARDFICFGEIDVTVIVCDAVCLERNLNLVLQIMEINPKVIVCVNLLDEAKKKKIHIDLKALSSYLGVPVVGTSAREKKGLAHLLKTIEKTAEQKYRKASYVVHYNSYIEKAIDKIEPYIKEKVGNLNTRWVSLKLIDQDPIILETLKDHLGINIVDTKMEKILLEVQNDLLEQDIILSEVKDDVVASIIKTAEDICQKVVVFEKEDYRRRDKKIDQILTSKWFGIPIMLALLCTIFWITMIGANVPSTLLSNGLFWISDQIEKFLNFIHMPAIVTDIFINGVYKVLAWVVSVMLPPMAIFFPLFTLLEDLGYLPRIAFNLDKYFKKCSACGKQALSMCMGFGCNAVGVTGCRIIDSPRERLLAILTNAFVPCNGRFPMLITLIGMFLFTGGSGFMSSFILTIVILISILMTLLMSKILSKTVLKGVPSSFTLELPPYRKPQIGKVIIHSIFDRTLFVLGRAIMVAAPAGLIIWLLANLQIGDASLLKICSDFLDPFAKIFGMDGVILMAFILGFPANEIVIPIMIMGYMSLGSLTEVHDLEILRNLFVQNGWTLLTALCVMTFCLFHFPCSTTCLTIKKETGSFKWTIFSMILPTVIGLMICFLLTQCVHVFRLL